MLTLCVSTCVCVQIADRKGTSDVIMCMSLKMDSPHRLAACVLEIKITALQTQFQCGLNITHTCTHTPNTHTRTRSAPAPVVNGCSRWH